MKAMATRLSLVLRLGQQKSNPCMLIKFAGALVLFFVFYSVVFHPKVLAVPWWWIA